MESRVECGQYECHSNQYAVDPVEAFLRQLLKVYYVSSEAIKQAVAHLVALVLPMLAIISSRVEKMWEARRAALPVTLMHCNSRYHDRTLDMKDMLSGEHLQDAHRELVNATQTCARELAAVVAQTRQHLIHHRRSFNTACHGAV